MHRSPPGRRLRLGGLEDLPKRGGPYAGWADVMAQSFRIQAGDWPALYWVRWNRDADPARSRRFSYGSLLLSYRPSSHRFQYGGPFGLQKPDDLFFYDWGPPESSPSGI